MLKLTQRCLAIKLSINLKKSNLIVFRPRERRQTLDISIQIDNNIIMSKDMEKRLPQLQ